MLLTRTAEAVGHQQDGAGSAARRDRRTPLVAPWAGHAPDQPGHCSEARGEDGDSFQNKSGVAKNTIASYRLWRLQRSSMLDTVGSPPVANGRTWWNSTNARSP